MRKYYGIIQRIHNQTVRSLMEVEGFFIIQSLLIWQYLSDIICWVSAFSFYIVSYYLQINTIFQTFQIVYYYLVVKRCFQMLISTGFAYKLFFNRCPCSEGKIFIILFHIIKQFTIREQHIKLTVLHYLLKDTTLLLLLTERYFL